MSGATIRSACASDTTPDRIGADAIGDTAGDISRQARAHPRFETREVLGRHSGELWTDARPALNNCPVLVEIDECPLHGDLPRVDVLQARTRPQLPHGIDSRRVRARRYWNRNAQPTHFIAQRVVRKATVEDRKS